MKQLKTARHCGTWTAEFGMSFVGWLVGWLEWLAEVCVKNRGTVVFSKDCRDGGVLPPSQSAGRPSGRGFN
jgi:hypothetical protein